VIQQAGIRPVGPAAVESNGSVPRRLGDPGGLIENPFSMAEGRSLDPPAMNILRALSRRERVDRKRWVRVRGGVETLPFRQQFSATSLLLRRCADARGDDVRVRLKLVREI